MKTLHPAIHAGLLARRDRPDDMRELEAQGYGPIDLVAVNLYPFRETVARPDVTLPAAMEKVDIGGPTMIRAAAKNHRDVWVVVDPRDYGRVLDAVDDPAGDGRSNDATGTERLKRELAAKVFDHISMYDSAVAQYLTSELGANGDGSPGSSNGGAPRGVSPGAGQTGAAASEAAARTAPEPMPEHITWSLARRDVLRYGENPDQHAAFYAEGTGQEGIAGLVQHHGKALSYNNILDVDGALMALSPFAGSPRAAVCIIKHTTPCGLAVAESVADAFGRARETDPVSSFGSVISVNRTVDGDAARAMSDLFVECIVAPAFTDEAIAELTKKKNLRILSMPGDVEVGEGTGANGGCGPGGRVPGPAPVGRESPLGVWGSPGPDAAPTAAVRSGGPGLDRGHQESPDSGRVP